MKYSGEALDILKKGVFDVLDDIVDMNLSKDALLDFYQSVKVLALRDLTQSPEHPIYQQPHSTRRHTPYVPDFKVYYSDNIYI